MEKRAAMRARSARVRLRYTTASTTAASARQATAASTTGCATSPGTAGSAPFEQNDPPASSTAAIIAALNGTSTAWHIPPNDPHSQRLPDTCRQHRIAADRAHERSDRRVEADRRRTVGMTDDPVPRARHGGKRADVEGDGPRLIVFLGLADPMTP
jgi:hypothetical protein